METLPASDVRAILRFVGDTYEAAPHAGFRLGTITRLRALVPADMTAWVETHTGQPGIDVVASPADPLSDGPSRFARVRDEHPVLAHFEATRHGGAAKLSDFFARSEYHRLPIYHEFFRPARVEHQISIALPTRLRRRLIRITLNRGGRDFSERDRLVLDLVREHVARAHRSASHFARFDVEHGDLARVAETLGAGLILVREDGRVSEASARALTLLERHFSGAPLRHGRLPDVLAEWLRAERRPRLRGGIPVPQGMLVFESEAGRLEIRSLRGKHRRLLVLRERVTHIEPRRLESLGLTRRQAEVLAYLAQGKANGEIAGVLGISPNTVARHVEAIFGVLGVQTRTAAAAAAFAQTA